MIIHRLGSSPYRIPNDGQVTYVLPNEHMLDLGRSTVPESDLIAWAIKRLPEGRDFVDVGACYGSWALAFAVSGKAGYVHAFEPRIQNFRALRAATTINSLDDVMTTHRCALGSLEQEGSGVLEIIDEGGGSSLLHSTIHAPLSGSAQHSRPLRCETVLVCTLDSFELENVGLLKIDTEGNDVNVIRGAVETLEINGWPPFVFEAWEHAWFSDRKREVIELVQSLGYQVRLGSADAYIAER